MFMFFLIFLFWTDIDNHLLDNYIFICLFFFRIFILIHYFKIFFVEDYFFTIF